MVTMLKLYISGISTTSPHQDHTTHQGHDVLHPHILHFYALLQSVDLGQDLFTFPFHHNLASLPHWTFFGVELRILQWF